MSLIRMKTPDVETILTAACDRPRLFHGRNNEVAHRWNVGVQVWGFKCWDLMLGFYFYD